MAAAGGSWKGGAFMPAGSAQVAELTPGERIERLAQLGRLSDNISRLNQRALRAQAQINSIYKRTGRPGLQRARERWTAARDELQIAYRESTTFSDRNGITRLPEPSGLQQAGAQ